LESAVYIASIDCRLSLQEVFDRVIFPDLEVEEGEVE
jgi:hypothetical protein